MSNHFGKLILATGLLLSFMFLGEKPSLQAQAVSIASVTGRVVDTSGAAVSGAQIKMTAVDTGQAHNVLSNAEGIYTIPSLPIGAYTLEVTASGFSTYVQKGITLQVNDAVQVNVSLTVGQVTQKVEVQADVTQVQTQQNTISQVMDQRRKP